MDFLGRLILGTLVALIATWAACGQDSGDHSSDSQSVDSTDTGTDTGTEDETGSDSGTGSQTEVETDTPSDTDTTTNTESDTTTPGDGFCHYVMTFSVGFPICREYLATWTPQEKMDDCADPFMGMSGPGVLDGTPCSTEELIGTCVFDRSADHSVQEYYYTGPIDVYETSCTGILGGEWKTEVTGLPEWAGPMDEALPALVSDTDVTVEPDDCSDDSCMLGLYEDKGWITFEPADVTPTVGLVFWPGGVVDLRSYAVVARAIAEAGVLVALPFLPSNIVTQAQDIVDANPGIATWYFGGHSMGGATAQQLAFFDATMITGGLVLFAGPGSEAADLSDATFDVLFVSATLDGVCTPTVVEGTKIYLPAAATYVAIEGGNHAQFGHYGVQVGDNAATITRAAQQAQAVAAALGFMGIGL